MTLANITLKIIDAPGSPDGQIIELAVDNRAALLTVAEARKLTVEIAGKANEIEDTEAAPTLKLTGE